MKKTVPRGGTKSRPTHTATLTLADQELAERCRNAPPAVQRAIDTWRESRGLPRLWPGDVPAKPRTTARRTPPTSVRRLKKFLAQRGKP